MKKIFLVLALILTGFAKSGAQNCTDCRPQFSTSQIPAIALADLTIDAMIVNCNAGVCKAKITVKNLWDDTSQETQLVVILPAETKLNSASGDGTTNKLCGNTITFCLGEMNPGVTKTVLIETTSIANPNYKDMETFGAFVSGSLPDLCPVNNFKSWVNTAVSEDCKKFKHVKIGKE